MGRAIVSIDEVSSDDGDEDEEKQERDVTPCSRSGGLVVVWRREGSEEVVYCRLGRGFGGSWREMGRSGLECLEARGKRR